MSSIVDLLAKNIFQKAIVSYKAAISPHAFHIRLQDDTFKSHPYIPGEHLRLFVGLDKGTALNEKLRTYSIWAHNAAEGTVDIAACTHSPGVGTTWAREVQAGDTIYYKGPTAKLTINHSAASYLMVGDDSALSHLYAIRRGIPAVKDVKGLIYANDKADLFPDIDGSRPFKFLSLPPNPTDRLIAEISAIRDQLSPATIVYLAGDARVCKALARFLKQEMRLDGSRIQSKGFWMPGKTGMD
jgi:NADPH-dependent ferric siderophore reductase